MLLIGLVGCDARTVSAPEECAYRDHADGSWQLPDGGVTHAYIDGPYIGLVEGKAKALDGGTLVPLRISATVPCLQGGMVAFLNTSAGTLGGKGPGEEVSVFLSPTETELDVGRLAGEIEFVIPTGREARVQATALESSRAVQLLASDEGTVLIRD
ncbi:hypothetical protein D7X55_23940 [Corallococcus sp. AB049A]|nr:hypothetical protein D7X55_23940 [Corallococcus sp. AB049A]